MNEVNKISYGLYVVTANGEKVNGCVVNSFTQVTSMPNRVALTINKSNYTTGLIEKSKEFNISILNTNTKFDIIKHFGFSSGKDTNKFENFSDFKLAPNGLPYITQNSCAYICCKVFDQKDLGTHIMYFADVVGGETLSEIEPVTYAYYQSNIKPQRKTEKVAYVCSVCGFVYEGDVLPDDYICPLCKHDASVFVKQGTEKTQEKSEENKEKIMDKYVCPICGYSVESETKPDKCIICGAQMEKVEK